MEIIEGETRFNATQNCGEVCGGNYLGTTVFYCEKGQKCCPSGPDEQTCSSSCGPYDPRRKYTEIDKIYHRILKMKKKYRNKH